MKLQPLIKSLSPKFVGNAIRTFDRATTAVVGICWAAAIVVMGFSIYAVALSASTRHAAEVTAGAEPVLPQIVSKPMDAADAKSLVERLQHLYPDLTFSTGSDQALLVAATEGTKFREWLTAIAYIDTISAKYRWTVKDFCVGKCGAGALMHAVLIGEKVSFEAPQIGK